MSRYSYARRRRLAFVASIPIVILAFGVFGAVAAGAADGAPDARLLQAYQPVLVFHPSEPFRPTKVQSFIEDSQLERFVGTSASQMALDAYWALADPDPEPGGLPSSPLYRLNQVGCEADSALAGRDCYAAAWGDESGGDAMYGRVVRTQSNVVLQYWLFYYDNPLILPTPLSGFWQSHEGDWELVNVILDADERPVEAAYSQHCTGQRRAWSSVTKSPTGSTHPVAFVALGSHANYFQPGLGQLGLASVASACVPAAVPAPIRPFVFDQVLDGSSVGAVVGPPGTGVQAATIHRIEGMPWADFGGRWGESEYLFTPVAIPPVPAGTAVPFGLAPASPANQSNWNTATVLGWPVVP